MKGSKKIRQRARRWWLMGAFMAVCLSVASSAAPTPTPTDPLHDLLDRTSTQVSKFLDQFSDTKCTEQVLQEKFKANGKLEYKEQSTFDYLVILTNAGGELSLAESRLAVRVHDHGKNDKVPSLLISNGFATLFLVFHPYYANSFQFTDAGPDTIGGLKLEKIQFQHIRDMRSPAALALRGREFPLEIAGTAWVDVESGMIVKIEAGVGRSLEDVGLKTLRSEVIYAPVPFKGMDKTYWYPQQAIVEVETPRQHWRNTHKFTDYKRFSVSTEEKVAEK
jgi:hypothetical protein